MSRPLYTRRLGPTQLLWFDVLVAAGLTLALTPQALSTGLDRWAALALVVALGLPLAVRRVWPRVVFLLVLAVAVPVMLLGVQGAYLPPAYALYAVAVSGPRVRWRSTVAMGATAALLLFVLAAMGAPAPPSAAVEPGQVELGQVLGGSGVVGEALLGLALLAGTWSVGRAVHERRGYAARDAENLAAVAVAEERLRLARELHDVVTHTLGLITVKAGVANHVVDSRPEEARDALRVIETASRGALGEMRRLVGVLRVEADRDPLPGLTGLPQLAERARLAGVPVELAVGEGIRLPEGMELAVYRIVQESLTNVIKHAGPCSCRVTVSASAGVVRVEVTDDGSLDGGGFREGHGVVGMDGFREGHGLIGMRERTLTYGGVFTAGPRPEGGFQVLATFPEPA
ncbi:histidine kinase [Nonomuraea sp. NPDC050310]|uniref:histidine kinase n=1 Tax=Nonomuraea sp. NPDC050310 TaxID=3154935 RepID=UPI0033EE50C4